MTKMTSLTTTTTMTREDRKGFSGRTASPPAASASRPKPCSGEGAYGVTGLQTNLVEIGHEDHLLGHCSSKPRRGASGVRGGWGATRGGVVVGFLATGGRNPDYDRRLDLLRSGDVEVNPGPVGNASCEGCGETFGPRPGAFRCAAGCERRSHRRQACSGLPLLQQKKGAWRCGVCGPGGNVGPQAQAPLSPPPPSPPGGAPPPSPPGGAEGATNRTGTPGRGSEGLDESGAPGSPDVHPLNASSDDRILGPTSPAPMTPQPRRMDGSPGAQTTRAVDRLPSPRSPSGGAGAEVNRPGTPSRSPRVDATPSPGNRAGVAGNPRYQGRVNTPGEVRVGMDEGGSPRSPDVRPLSAPFDGGASGPNSPAPLTPQPRRMNGSPIGRLPSPRFPPGGAGAVGTVPGPRLGVHG